MRDDLHLFQVALLDPLDNQLPVEAVIVIAALPPARPQLPRHVVAVRLPPPPALLEVGHRLALGHQMRLGEGDFLVVPVEYIATLPAGLFTGTVAENGVAVVVVGAL